MIDLRKKIGIIGFGNMGSAIALNLAQLKSEFSVYAFDKERDKLAGLTGIGIVKDSRELLEKTDTIILAVKPQELDHVLKEIKKESGGKLIISIAAGITTRHIEKILGENPRVIRAMPNIAAKVGESVTCLCKGAHATDEDLELAQELFNSIGCARVIDEGMMNAATAISGSGPAYIFYFIENNALETDNLPEGPRRAMMKRLEKAAEDLGFPLEDAAFLAANTTNSSISLLHKTKLPPEELRRQVTSKGGTTEAALEVLSKGGSWEEAAHAALKRAEALARRD